MTILFIIAMTILVIAILGRLFTDVHPAVFYSAWLLALGLLVAGDVVQGWWWGAALHVALAVFAAWAWRKDAQDRSKRAAA